MTAPTTRRLFASSSSVASATATAIAAPKQWHKSVRRVALHKILPSHYLRSMKSSNLLAHVDGTHDTNQQPYDAWRGDKILGAAAAKTMSSSIHSWNITASPALSSSRFFSSHTTEPILNPGSASMLTSLALSNAFMAKHFEILLPDVAVAVAAIEDNVGRKLSDRQKGTILEAAVAQVSDADAGNGDAALADLASWLLRVAKVSHPPQGDFRTGGVEVVHILRVHGTPDHKPVFEATARIHGKTAVARAGRKKLAKLMAMNQLTGK